VMISLPDDLLDRIDREARRQGTSRSALLREAASSALGHADRDELDAAIARSRARFAEDGSFEAGELVRSERDARDRHDRRPL